MGTDAKAVVRLSIEERLMLEKVLQEPRVAKDLHPAVEQGLIGFIEGVLQVMQPDQQTRGFAGCSEVRAVAVSKDSFEAFAVNLLCRYAQRMVEIQELFKLSLKQIKLAGFAGRSRHHAAFKLPCFGPGRSLSLQIQ